MSRLEMQYQGADWLQRHLDASHAAAATRRSRCKASKIVSPLGRTVADVIGLAWRGIYHLPPGSLDTPAWHDPNNIMISVPVGHLSTYDGDTLIVLVVACFDTMLRLEIASSGPRRIGLSFSRRRSRTGNTYERLPHLDDMVNSIRRGYVVVEDPQEQSA